MSKLNKLDKLLKPDKPDKPDKFDIIQEIKNNRQNIILYFVLLITTWISLIIVNSVFYLMPFVIYYAYNNKIIKIKINKDFMTSLKTFTWINK